jgi:GNAT superfamily N-acetyltransferase
MRPYRTHAQDAEAVMAFLSGISLHPRYVSDYQIGDFVWQGYRGLEPSFAETLSIWEHVPGEIVALGWFEPPNEFAFAIHPAQYDSTDGARLIRQMVGWAEEHYSGQAEIPAESIGLIVSADDVMMQRVLTEHGYHYSGETRYAANFRTVDGSLAPPEIADGYEIVAMTEDADLVDRVEVHRDVWAPSKFTLEAYRQLRQAPVYRPDLDMAVRAPDGRFACYLIAWWDPAAKSGLLEPVGARAEYRRLGLTKALIQETLIRLRDMGATRCYVNSRASAVPANALYRSAGFQRIVDLQSWTKQEQ